VKQDSSWGKQDSSWVKQDSSWGKFFEIKKIVVYNGGSSGGQPDVALERRNSSVADLQSPSGTTGSCTSRKRLSRVRTGFFQAPISSYPKVILRTSITSGMIYFSSCIPSFAKQIDCILECGIRSCTGILGQIIIRRMMSANYAGGHRMTFSSRRFIRRMNSMYSTICRQTPATVRLCLERDTTVDECARSSTTS